MLTATTVVLCSLPCDRTDKDTSGFSIVVCDGVVIYYNHWLGAERHARPERIVNLVSLCSGLASSCCPGRTALRIFYDKASLPGRPATSPHLTFNY